MCAWYVYTINSNTSSTHHCDSVQQQKKNASMKNEKLKRKNAVNQNLVQTEYLWQCIERMHPIILPHFMYNFSQIIMAPAFVRRNKLHIQFNLFENKNAHFFFSLYIGE